MFALTKWYLDVVTSDGTALVAYSARLRWGPVRLSYAALLLSPPGGPASEDTSLRHGALPSAPADPGAGPITWTDAHLGLTGEWRAESPPIEADLLELPEGRIHWQCLAPRAQARASLGDRELAGRGYVERLDLSIPPHRLPFRTLRWGRHGSARHAVVWIDWDGSAPARRVWLDGVLKPAAMIGPAGLPLDQDVRLELDPGRDLRDREVTRSVTALVPTLTQRLAPLAGMREHKRLSRSRLVGERGPIDVGWTIHEEVTW